jgi:hypothetical protein
MSLLEDYDVSNDWQTYDILSKTLLKAGDEVNGRATRILFLYEWRKSHIDDTAAESSGNLNSDPIGDNLDETKISGEVNTTNFETHKLDDINGPPTLDPVTIKTSPRVITQETNFSDANTKTQTQNSVKINNLQINGSQVMPEPQATN